MTIQDGVSGFEVNCLNSNSAQLRGGVNMKNSLVVNVQITVVVKHIAESMESQNNTAAKASNQTRVQDPSHHPNTGNNNNGG